MARKEAEVLEVVEAVVYRLAVVLPLLLHILRIVMVVVSWQCLRDTRARNTFEEPVEVAGMPAHSRQVVADAAAPEVEAHTSRRARAPPGAHNAVAARVRPPRTDAHAVAMPRTGPAAAREAAGSASPAAPR